MNWASLAESVRLAVATATGLPDVEPNPGHPVKRVRWANTAEAANYANGPRAFLTMRSPRGVGVDETRREYDSGADRDIVTQCGVRQFTVSVKLETDTQVPGADASALASQLRTRLRRPAVLDALHVAGIALMRVERTVDADWRDKDGRWISCTVTDLQLSAAENDVDDTNDGEIVVAADGNGTGDLTGVDFDADAS